MVWPQLLLAKRSKENIQFGWRRTTFFFFFLNYMLQEVINACCLQQLYIVIKYIYFILGRWTAALDQRFTWQWICGHSRTRRPWCSTFLYEPPAGVRLSHSHYLHLFLSARRGKCFTVGCIWLPAKCSRAYAPATTHNEEPIFDGVGTYEMPAYPASSMRKPFQRCTIWLEFFQTRWAFFNIIIN